MRSYGRKLLYLLYQQQEKQGYGSRSAAYVSYRYIGEKLCELARQQMFCNTWWTSSKVNGLRTSIIKLMPSKCEPARSIAALTTLLIQTFCSFSKVGHWCNKFFIEFTSDFNDTSGAVGAGHAFALMLIALASQIHITQSACTQLSSTAVK